METIKEVSSYKHLGASICLSSDETWHEHINYISAKAWIRVNVMRNLKFLLDRRSLEMIYVYIIYKTTVRIVPMSSGTAIRDMKLLQLKRYNMKPKKAFVLGSP